MPKQRHIKLKNLLRWTRKVIAGFDSRNKANFIKRRFASGYDRPINKRHSPKNWNILKNNCRKLYVILSIFLSI